MVIKIITFTHIQLLCYILSSIAMSCYTIHWYNFGKNYERTRILNHLIFEVVLVLIRFYNEIYFKRIDINDILHHSMFIFVVILIAYIEKFHKYCWLVCHMQILHYPLSLWYYSCRSKCISTNTDIIIISKKIFSPLWLFSSYYRASIMLCTMIIAINTNNELASSIILSTSSMIFIYLDYEWTKIFLLKQNCSRIIQLFASALGIFVGYIVTFNYI